MIYPPPDEGLPQYLGGVGEKVESVCAFPRELENPT